MTAKKIHARLEQLINSLTIKDNHKTFFRGKTNDLYDELNYVSRNQIPSNGYQYTLERFWYGGSFDRGIFIKNRFDVDLYLVFSHSNSYSQVTSFNIINRSQKHVKVTGNVLFELTYSTLRNYQQTYGGRMKILKNPPYGHSIPIRMDYQGTSILFDCIPAIEFPNGYLVIPNGVGDTKKVNPLLEEQALSKLNKRV